MIIKRNKLLKFLCVMDLCIGFDYLFFVVWFLVVFLVVVWGVL